MDIDKRHIVLNAFRPSTEIFLPSQFAGRKELIGKLTDALHMEGACPIVYGDRGLGKTSLATQIVRIAVGDVELLGKFDMLPRGLKGEECYFTFYVSCTDDVQNKDDILQRLINCADGFQDITQLPKMEAMGRTITNRITFKFYENKVEEHYKNIGKLSEYTNLSVEEKLDACSRFIYETYGKKVLCIIDEIDRVYDTSGLSSFIKSFSSDRLKFMLVGVGGSVSSLLQDHQSIDRILIPIQVVRMEEKELLQIVNLTEIVLKLFEIEITFSEEAKKLLINTANGFPWFVHVLGQEALIEAYDKNDKIISEEMVQKTIENLVRNRFVQNFDNLYIKAVGDSRPRETIMRLFAKWGHKDIPTSDIYPIAHRLGITNPSLSVKELQQKNYGTILERVPYREKGGVYTFRNSMFQHFINLRSSVYQNLTVRIDQAWKDNRR